MTFGSLFAGIGGIDLGLERAGMTCKWQVEIDPWCRQVLAKHWPNVTQYEDVTRFCRRIYDCDPEDEDGYVNCPRCDVDFAECGCIGTDQLVDTHGYVDLIAGGFPCQDVSNAGQKAGIKEGTRSGLWSEFHRIIRELRPRYVLVENVSGLLARGMGRVLGDLSTIGYDAEWEVLSAADVGAPHLRKRVFIVADAQGSGLQGGNQALACNSQTGRGRQSQSARGIARKQEDVADAQRERSQGRVYRRSDSGRENLEGYAGCSGTAYGQQRENWWTTEPDVGRVAHGVPQRVDRLKGLGNAVVPQCAEQIGRRIMEQRGH